ncbi:MAG: diaminopimelate decarboxylase [Clostridiales Family XIII bacterium]|jgi:diaminopimelate decarboxylase|nr:diaminopimelate decarboxylase [Clostridiales Family XIII bacterium]
MSVDHNAIEKTDAVLHEGEDSVFYVRDGALYIEGVRASDLAKKYGTPLYVYSNRMIRERFAEIRRDFLDRYSRNDGLGDDRAGAYAAYAAKAFLTPVMCRIVAEEGFLLDVVSGGEFFTAIQAGFPADRIKYHGNNKTIQELEEAIGAGVGRIVIDGLDELFIIEEIAERAGRIQPVLFRITPEVSAGAHDHITTGRRDSKFGVPMDEDVLYPLVGRAVESPHIHFLGLHFHVGSQLFDPAPYIEATGKALGVIDEINRRFAYSVPELCIGGGFGIRYTRAEERQPYAAFTGPVVALVNSYCEERGLIPPDIGIEPGRSIVGDAGVTLYTVGSIKQIPDGPKYVSIDGGMSDNIRPALYGAVYEAMLADKAAAKAADKETVTICGKLCESGDRIIDGASLAKAERGDILCVFSTGAYGYSMASNYNKIPKAAACLVDGEEARLIVRRQTYEEMIAPEI